MSTEVEEKPADQETDWNPKVSHIYHRDCDHEMPSRPGTVAFCGVRKIVAATWTEWGGTLNHSEYTLCVVCKDLAYQDGARCPNL